MVNYVSKSLASPRSKLPWPTPTINCKSCLQTEKTSLSLQTLVDVAPLVSLLTLSPNKRLFGTSKPAITGWSFHVNEHGVVECKGNNVYAPLNSGNHKVFTDSKPYTEREVKVMPRFDAVEES